MRRMRRRWAIGIPRRMVAATDLTLHNLSCLLLNNERIVSHVCVYSFRSTSQKFVYTLEV